MSEQGTEKTNPLHGLERDGTGTGVWTHPAAEAKQPEQPKQCECGQSDFDGRVWSWRGVGTRRVCVANSTLSGYCPACGCRLSVVDGEPVVGLSVRAVIEQLRLAHDELYEDASLYHEGGDDKGDGAFAWGKQCGYRHAIKMLGGEADGE